MSYALLAEGWGGEAYLAADVIKDRYHAAHVGGGEDWVEKLALLAVVIAWNIILRKAMVVACLDDAQILTEGSE